MDYLFYCPMDSKRIRKKIAQLGNGGKLLEVLKHVETHIIVVRLKI